MMYILITTTGMGMNMVRHPPALSLARGFITLAEEVGIRCRKYRIAKSLKISLIEPMYVHTD